MYDTSIHKARIKALLVACALLLMVSPQGAGADDVTLSPEAENCIGCHGTRGIEKKFENSDLIEAYIDVAKFRSSVHNFLTCSDCHTDFSEEKHPQRRFRSKEQYQARSSLICRKCHALAQMEKSPLHAGLFKEEEKGRLHICTNCHGTHTIERVVTSKLPEEREVYCLNCHGHKVSKRFQNGVELSLTVDMQLLRASVHNELDCSDCHFGFSTEEHPKRNFNTLREYQIATSETCRRCHFNKYSEVLESIHYAMLSRGNLSAPVCTDCHGSHSIAHSVKDKILVARRCEQCHAGIYDIYINSVHGKALFDEHIQDVPVCTDCHKAHNIKNPLSVEYHEHIPDMCSDCHSNKAIVAKYGLSSDVVNTYLSDFHGVTLNLYKKEKEAFYRPARPIAVCTDCHGIHDITSEKGVDPKVVKANLVKRCQKCHADATENFPDAWLLHYRPSLAKAPMVFIISIIYKFFIPLTLIGLVIQILLHIWRYAVNR